MSNKTPFKRSRNSYQCNSYENLHRRPDGWPPQDISPYNECAEKDKKLQQYRDRIERYDKMAKQHTNEIQAKNKELTDLKEEIKELKQSKEDYEKKQKGINSYVNEVNNQKKALTTKIETIEIRHKTELESFHKSFETNEKLISTLKSQKLETEKRLQTQVQKLEKDIRSLNAKLSLKASDLSESVETLQKTNADLKKELEVKQIMSNKYKITSETANKKMEEMETKYKELKAKLQKTQLDNASLIRQRKYFQKNNENNKRKAAASGATTVKQKRMTHKYMTKLGKDNLEIDGQVKRRILDAVSETINKHLTEARSEKLAAMANTCKEARQEVIDIEEAEQRILEKSSDGKEACGEKGCGKTFKTVGDLKHHMTVAHQINTTDKTKNSIELITIE